MIKSTLDIKFHKFEISIMIAEDHFLLEYNLPHIVIHGKAECFHGNYPKIENKNKWSSVEKRGLLIFFKTRGVEV